MSVAVSPGILDAYLSPGEIFEGEFKVLNPSLSGETISYVIKPAPMTVEDELYSLDFEDITDYSQVLDWIEIEESTGVLAPHEEKTIKFRISVPPAVNPPLFSSPRTRPTAKKRTQTASR